MTGSVDYPKYKKLRIVLTETFKQYYPQTLELTSVYNDGSWHVSTKWEKKLLRTEKIQVGGDLERPTKRNKAVNVSSQVLTALRFYALLVVFY